MVAAKNRAVMSDRNIVADFDSPKRINIAKLVDRYIGSDFKIFEMINPNIWENNNFFATLLAKMLKA